MNLNEWLQSPAAIKLGYTLLHSLWQGTALCAIVVILLAVFRKSNAALRYLITASAMTAFLIAPLLTFLYLNAQPVQAAPAKTPIHETRPTTPPTPTNQRPTAPQNHTAIVAVNDPASPSVTPAISPFPPTAATLPAAPTALTGSNPAPSLIDGFYDLMRLLQCWLLICLPRIVMVWALGVSLLSLRHLGGWLVLQRLRVIGTQPAPSSLTATLSRLATRLHISRPVQLMLSTRVETPMLIGMWKPLRGYPNNPEERNAIMAQTKCSKPM